MGIQETKSAIRQNSDDTEQIVAQVQAASDSIETLSTRLTAVTADTSSATAEEAAGLYGQARDRLDEAIGLIKGATDKANDYATTI